MTFDVNRATLNGPNLFKPFKIYESGIPLANAGLDSNKEIIIFERGGEQRALIISQMAYHHAAQGELAGEPYLITF